MEYLVFSPIPSANPLVSSRPEPTPIVSLSPILQRGAAFDAMNDFLDDLSSTEVSELPLRADLNPQNASHDELLSFAEEHFIDSARFQLSLSLPGGLELFGA